MLEGKLVNLRKIEKEDVDFLVGLGDYIDFWAEYNNPPFGRMSKSEWMKWFDAPRTYLEILIEWSRFIIQKKDGTRIGLTWHFTNQPSGHIEIACFLIPSERGKGYGTEAVQLMVDDLFIYRKILFRIQATANVENRAAQRVLEKAGFKAEGTIRKLSFVRGEWKDKILYDILLEEWKEPRILTKTK
jgi:RimJ/RimL family protein N-acetyltransferase